MEQSWDTVRPLNTEFVLGYRQYYRRERTGISEKPSILAYSPTCSVIEGNSANDRSYAKISIAYCCVGKKDPEGAKKAAQELVDLKGAMPEYVEMAKSILKG